MWKTLLTSLRNRGELAEGWYDPTTLHNAAASTGSLSRRAALGKELNQSLATEVAVEVSSDEDVLGPSLPSGISADIKTSARSGPAIPNQQDLELQKGMFDSSCIVA